MGKLAMIPLDQIRANPVALRNVKTESEPFRQLVDSVRAKGVINAISVREKTLLGDDADGKTYELIDGLQRFSAAVEVGTGSVGDVGMIPAQILEQNDQDALETQIIGNAHRVETRPVEYAQAMMRLLAFNPTWTEAQLAEKLSKSPAWVGKQLGLLRLADNIKPLVDEGKIVVANAFVLAKLPPDEQQNWIERAMTMNSSEFTGLCLARAKEIKDANRQGSDATEETFTAIAHLRKKTELEESLKDGLPVADTLIAEIDVADIESAKTGFELGVKWVLNLDPESIKVQQQKFEETKKQRESDRAKRDQEKKDKKAKELADKLAEAQKAADEARANAVTA